MAKARPAQRAPIVRVSFGDEAEGHYDNFAGGGGASTAYELAMEILTGQRRSPDAAINHDAEAIGMHAANHPTTKHYIESVWKVDPREVCGGKRPRSAWFSPDCKHFSQAKGGEPRDQKIRSLAWVMSWWAHLVGFDVGFLENVPEFEGWGPLHRTHSGKCRAERGEPCPATLTKSQRKTCHFGRPIKSRKGETFRAFVRKLESFGYVVEWRLLRACDYGAPTTRRRLFLVARRDGMPIVWPKPTHGPAALLKPPTLRELAQQVSMFADATPATLRPYRTAAECIDWSIPCPSIFDRKKPLKPKTLARIARGIRKYVLGAARPFVVPVNHGGAGRRDHRIHDVDAPLPTVTGGQRGGHAVVTPYLMANNTNNVPTGLGEPVPTVTTGNRNFVVAPTLVRTAHGDVDASGKRRGTGSHSIEQPLGTVCASGGDFAIAVPYLVHRSNGERVGQAPRIYDAEAPLGTIVAGGQKHALCSAFLAKHYGGNESSSGGTPATAPVDAITARDHHSLVSAHLVRYNGERRDGEQRGAAVGQPLPTQDTSNRFGLVASHLIKLQGTSEAHLEASASSMESPVPSITAGGWKMAQVAAFLVRYNGQGDAEPVDAPAGTLTTKPRFGLVTVTIDGEEYVVVDIGMRMLEPEELFAAQGFPRDYNIAPVVERTTKRGTVVRAPLTKTAQIRMCGNSVSPPPAVALLVANLGAAAEMSRAA